MTLFADLSGGHYFLDLEILRCLVATLLLSMLLIKQHFDSAKLEKRYFNIMIAFQNMPRVAESTVLCQTEILLQMRHLTKRLEALGRATADAESIAESDGKTA